MFFLTNIILLFWYFQMIMKLNTVILFGWLLALASKSNKKQNKEAHQSNCVSEYKQPLDVQTNLFTYNPSLVQWGGGGGGVRIEPLYFSATV